MKKILGLCLMMFLFSNAFAVTLGKVDIQKILVTVKEAKRVGDKVKAEFEKKQKELQGIEEQIKKDQEAFQKQVHVLNDKAKAKKQQEIQEKVMNLQQKAMAYQKEIQDLENSFKNPILNKINDIVSEVSKKEGVDFTYEISTSAILYAKDQKDLTDAVIKEYDKKHK